MKKIISISLSVMMILMVIMPISMAKTFTDVAADHWAYNYIDALSDKGVINGYDNGTFNPNGKITKAEYIKLLVTSVASKEEEEELKNNISSYKEWFEPYVNFADEMGVLPKEYSIDELKENVSRVEMAVLLTRFADYVGFVGEDDSDEEYEEAEGEFDESDYSDYYDIDEGEELIVEDDLDEIIDEDDTLIEDISSDELEFEVLDEEIFSDISDLDEEEHFDILYAYELELISGYDDGTFKPHNLMSRAEVATIIYRFTEGFVKEE